MDILIQTLNDNNIPYHRDKTHIMTKIKRSDVIIVPGCVILCRSKKTFINKDIVTVVADEISSMAEDMDIYLYLYPTDGKFTDEEADCVIDKAISYTDHLSNINVDILASPNDIMVYDFDYVADRCSPLWSMIADKRLYDKYKYIPIYTDQKTYDHTIVILTDDELSSLEDMDIRIEHPDGIICRLTREDYSTSINLMHEFLDKMKYVPLSGGLRNPTRHIDYITDYCKKCNTLMYKRHIYTDNCAKCRKVDLL